MPIVGLSILYFGFGLLSSLWFSATYEYRLGKSVALSLFWPFWFVKGLIYLTIEFIRFLIKTIKAVFSFNYQHWKER